MSSPAEYFSGLALPLLMDDAAPLHIFERSVQDHSVSLLLATASAGLSTSRRGLQPPTPTTRMLLYHTDFVPPVLDASVLHLAAEPDLEEVEMVYPRRLSVMGLSAALGMTSRDDVAASPPLRRQTSRTASVSSQGRGGADLLLGSKQSKSTLSFLSYHDMVSTDPQARRPLLSHTLLELFIREGPLPPSGLRTLLLTKHLRQRAASTLLQARDPRDTSATGGRFTLASPDTLDEEEFAAPNHLFHNPPGSPTRLVQLSFHDVHEDHVVSTVGECLRNHTNDIRG